MEEEKEREGERREQLDLGLTVMDSDCENVFFQPVDVETDPNKFAFLITLTYYNSYYIGNFNFKFFTFLPFLLYYTRIISLTYSVTDKEYNFLMNHFTQN